jgi:hypothetical protein
LDPDEAGGFMEEAVMASRTTRPAARAKILAAFAAQLDRIIPVDEAVPLKGATFADFEDQVETLAQAALPVVLEQRAAVAPDAEVNQPGRCPHCGAAAVYLENEVTQPAVRSRHGVVRVPRQHARCRGCGGSFSPAGAGLGAGGGSAADAARGAAAGSGERDASV